MEILSKRFIPSHSHNKYIYWGEKNQFIPYFMPPFNVGYYTVYN